MMRFYVDGTVMLRPFSKRARVARLCAIVAAGAGGALLINPAPAQSQSLGIWRNPKDSVHIRAEPCGRYICGVVVWANEKAKADSRKGGVDPLIGAQLFRQFSEERPNLWRGSVFVPDIRKTFSGTITIVDQHTIRASGCLIGRIGCKSQIWTRVDL
ncbi:DUF2147 domain-containing protein [Sphingobium sp. H39-3-25]|uniref:DUF2147 domain-containing protein n=1 Tax=Sphingomonadales TaxID=204457 RepID=UPI001FE0E430|nr:DUF2147 domain-containing protein [Novosphingobium naphthalenivorans]MDF0546640.1 DUF2147 domain-containing protein [Sphingobium arseniciresistens]